MRVTLLQRSSILAQDVEITFAQVDDTDVINHKPDPTLSMVFDFTFRPCRHPLDPQENISIRHEAI